MSRLLVLRRPQPAKSDLEFTAVNIAAGYRYGNNTKVQYIVRKLAQAINKFLEFWKGQLNNFPLFFGLRDFYGLIKTFMTKLTEDGEFDLKSDEAIL